MENILENLFAIQQSESKAYKVGYEKGVEFGELKGYEKGRIDAIRDELFGGIEAIETEEKIAKDLVI